MRGTLDRSRTSRRPTARASDEVAVLPARAQTGDVRLPVVILLLGVVGCAGRPSTRPRPPAERVPVGAIRWDAWTGEPRQGNDVGMQVERSLGPQHWHDRLPFFARVLSESAVEVRANTQAIMDQEIGYAHDAGLDYWAFVMYAPGNPATTDGLNLYLGSARHGDIRFAMIVQPSTFGDADLARLVGYFRDRQYQRVAGGRPLLFLGGPPRRDDPAWPRVDRQVARLRASAVAAGVGDPYIVHQWGWSGAKEVIAWLGLDAISAYSVQFDDTNAAFATLARKTEHKWDEWRATGIPVFPLVMTGWDRRPRVEHPVSWEPPNRPGAAERHYAAPTPAELETHLGQALSWCAAHPEAAPQGILIYAWNEIDEGGWLLPSLWPDQANHRLEAVRRALSGR